MRGLYERTIWTVIALALSLIALNPWLAPGRVGADSIMDVKIVDVRSNALSLVPPIPVVIVSGKK